MTGPGQRLGSVDRWTESEGRVCGSVAYLS